MISHLQPNSLRKPNSQHKLDSPLPVNSELNPFHPHQALPEFTGRGVGGEGPADASSMPTSYFKLRASTSGLNATPFPLTPSPSPRKFGERLIKWQSGKLRIFGERGVIFCGVDAPILAREVSQ